MSNKEKIRILLTENTLFYNYLLSFFKKKIKPKKYGGRWSQT